VFFGIWFSVDLSRSSNYSISINWRSKQRKLSGPRCSFLSESILMWWLTFVKTLRLKFGEFLSFLECKDFVSMSNLKNETRFLKKKKIERGVPFAGTGEKVIGLFCLEKLSLSRESQFQFWHEQLLSGVLHRKGKRLKILYLFNSEWR